jgi:hypothetical protein
MQKNIKQVKNNIIDSLRVLGCTKFEKHIGGKYNENKVK